LIASAIAKSKNPDKLLKEISQIWKWKKKWMFQRWENSMKKK
jgi:hypothetical protein